jgi:putative nucleotidyltransferase with HDIG domain
MTETDIRPLRRWFKQYVQSFYSSDADIQAHVRLKEEHTARVCARIAELSTALRLDGEQRTLAESVALFHDVGRFQQYTQYRTFNDFRSEDHACLGVRILRQTGVLSNLPQPQQELVQKAVRYHNGRDVPADSVEAVNLARMIRDVDKIDILAMITSDDELFRILPSPEFGGMAQVSPGTVEFILQGKVARFEHIRTAADQMLFRMSWLFDMNFGWTFQMVREMGYLEKMAAQLPQTGSVRRVVEYLAEYRDQRATVSA